MKDLQECFERKHADLLVSFTQALKKIAQQGTKELEKVLALLMDKLDGVDESSIEKITRNMQQAAKTAGRKLSASQTNVRALYGQKRERFIHGYESPVSNGGYSCPLRSGKTDFQGCVESRNGGTQSFDPGKIGTPESPGE